MRADNQNPEIAYSKRVLGSFLLVTLGLVFLVGGLIVILNIKLNSPAYYSFYAVGLLSPFLGALVYSWQTTSSFRLIKNMFLPLRLGSGAIMILAVPFSLLVSYLAGNLLSLPVKWDLLPPASSLLSSVLGWSAIIWLEETGWRGTLLPVLQQKFSPLVSTFLVNIVWVVWHLPLLYLIGMDLGELGLFFIQTLGIALAMTWAFNRTGTVLIATLIHGAFNGTSGWLLTAVPSMSPNELIGVQAAGPFVLGLLVLLLTNGRLGLQRKPVITLPLRKPGAHTGLEIGLKRR